ncbi:MAG: hypothetical protein NTV52_27760 [Acidobacteria bacterium]|nr:hypothetical protein [Acidobacteriota bacterium]
MGGRTGTRARTEGGRKRSRYVVCIENDGYLASLERRKLYEVVPDRRSESLGFVRVIDESGEDYLFPSTLFIKIAVPDSVRLAFVGSST